MLNAHTSTARGGNGVVRPKPGAPDFHANRPLPVALAMATRGVRLFPTYGFNSTRTGLECQCMKAARWRAEKGGEKAAPCSKNPGKHPRLKGWPDLATTDPEVITNWTLRTEGGWNRTNLSALTGRASGVWVLDLDGDLGFSSLTQLEEELGPLPPTWRTQSGSGNGRHYWFGHPEDGPEVRGSQGAVSPGVDVRGYHGHILIPGSLHRSGGRYRWERGYAPDEVPLALAPIAWLRAVLDANKKTRSDAQPDRQASPTRSAPSRAAKVRRQHARSLLIGDGEDRGGFHGPINSRLVQFFIRFGGDADVGPMIEALRTAILSAPAQNHEPYEIERYASIEHLTEAAESARAYVKGLNS